MKKYHDIVLDNTGNAVLSATITVSDVGGGVSSIYSDDGITPQANPFTASSIDGAYSFYAANGRYDINIIATGFVTENLTDVVLFDKDEVYTDFESTGIDDNATSNAMTIDASENVTFTSPLTSFESTGIDDNATSTQLTITDSDVTPAGTVDGRDIAADGTKLDGFDVAGNTKAWVNFNGQGTIAINDSHGVSSLTDNNVGDYTINLTDTQPNASYAILTGHSYRELGISGQTTTSFSVQTRDSSGALTDILSIHAGILGD